MKKSIVILYSIAALFIIAGLLDRYNIIHISSEKISGRMISVVGFILYVITKYFIAPKTK